MKGFLKILLVLSVLFQSSCSKGQVVEMIKWPGKVKFTYQGEITSPGVTNDTAYILDMWGQSNEPGRAPTSELTSGLAYLAAAIQNSTDTAFIRAWNLDSLNDDGFQVLQAGVNSGDQLNNNKYGSSIKFSYDFINWSHKNLYIFQAGQGGQNIAQWFQAVRNLYKYCDSGITQMVNRFTAQGRPVKFLATIWYQGETDGGSDTATYRSRLDSVVKLSRIRTGDPNLPFIIVELSDCQTDVTSLADFQDMQERYVLNHANTYLIAKGGGGCIDGLHVNGTKQRLISDAALTLIQTWYPWLDD